jgi:hypothetical protein
MFHYSSIRAYTPLKYRETDTIAKTLRTQERYSRTVQVAPVQLDVQVQVFGAEQVPELRHADAQTAKEKREISFQLVCERCFSTKEDWRGRRDFFLRGLVMRKEEIRRIVFPSDQSIALYKRSVHIIYTRILYESSSHSLMISLGIYVVSYSHSQKYYIFCLKKLRMQNQRKHVL